MFIVPILFTLMLLYKIKFAGFTSYHEDYLSLEKTNAIKGILAIIIVLHHLAVSLEDRMWLAPFNKNAGWLTVAWFFFFSGFGLMYGLINKKDYLKGFLLKRLPSIIIPLLTATVIYVPVKLLLGTKMDGIYLLEVLKFNEFFVDNSWYVFALIVLYVGFFFVFRYLVGNKTDNKKRMYIAITIFSIFVLLYEIGCLIFNGQFMWSASCITMALGTLWAYKQNQILNIIKKYYWLILIISVIGYLGGMAFMPIFNKVFGFYPPEFIAENIRCIFFVIIMTLITMKLSLANCITKYLGKISYEIYLIHGLYLLLLEKLVGFNKVVYVLAVVILTIVTAVILSKINKLLLNGYLKVLSNRKQLKEVR